MGRFPLTPHTEGFSVIMSEKTGQCKRGDSTGGFQMDRGKPAAAVLVGARAAVAAVGGSAIGTERVGQPPAPEPERRARRQPTVPGNYRELPFQEPAPIPTLSPAERQRGYRLFQPRRDFHAQKDDTTQFHEDRCDGRFESGDRHPHRGQFRQGG